VTNDEILMIRPRLLDVVKLAGSGKWSFDVDVHDFIKRFFRHFIYGCNLTDTGIVNKNIEVCAVSNASVNAVSIASIIRAPRLMT